MVDVRLADWSAVEEVIRRVPQYRNCRDITQEAMPASALRPLCLKARRYRLDRVAELLAAYELASIPLYLGVTLQTASGLRRLLAPPIVERHGSDYILVDGLHRVSLANDKGFSVVIVALAQGDLDPLPGSPLSWDEIETISHHTTRESKFRNFAPRHFRPISQFLDSDQ